MDTCHDTTWRRRKIRNLVLSLIAGTIGLAVGLVSLWHPLAFWTPGLPHRADLPPVWGAGALVIPVFLLGRAAVQIWWGVELDAIALRERRRRRRRTTS